VADPAEIPETLKQALSGTYELLRELGRGGMATVYLARDVKHDREVAIKVLLPELSATLGADRFEREIRLAAKLQHPHILGLFDSGSADGQLYYVMPFVKGESLRDRIDREKQLPIDEALQIILEVNDALGYAHAHGVVHRDIKPENILLSGGHALVADFGIARAVAEGGAGEKLTQTGMSMGTPYYMSPEQFTGETVGPPSDLYALGCVLYEMLAGEPPFTGANSMVLMAKHAMEQVPSIRIVRNVVPEDVENAIFIAMNKSPADRPQNAEQFAQLLGLGIGNTASMRVFTNTMQRRIPSQANAVLAGMTPWYRRPAAMATMGAMALVLGAAGFLGWKNLGSRSPAAIGGPEARRLAVLYFSDLSRDNSLGPLTDGLTEGLIRSFSTASSFDVISTTGVGRFRGSTASLDSIARALRVGYLVRGEAEPEGDRVRISVRLDDAFGVNLDRASFVVPAANLLGMRDTITTVVGDLLRRKLGQQFQISQQRASTSSQDSWLLMQRGEVARRSMEGAVGDTASIATHYAVADSLYAAASRADSRWAEPHARRAHLAYRRSRLTRDPSALRQWVATGLTHAASALALDPNSADALEVRGNLLYWSFLNNFEEEGARKAALIDDARAALEKAVSINPRQAGAYATLSHLYLNHPTASNTDAVIAAQRAYESDEFLAEAELVLARLVVASYDLGQFEKAEQWCNVARARFPSSWRSARCRLLLLTTRLATPDIAAAWRLADSVTGMAPNPRYYRLNSDMLVGAVIARASKSDPALADSARRVIRRSEGDPSVDPTRDLGLYGAIGYTILGDKADAIRLLKQYLAVNPQKTASFRDDPGWQYRDLMSEPAYRQLVGTR
jgi:eukaryotic-like serine/threonine-protein kinase